VSEKEKHLISELSIGVWCVFANDFYRVADQTPGGALLASRAGAVLIASPDATTPVILPPSPKFTALACLKPGARFLSARDRGEFVLLKLPAMTKIGGGADYLALCGSGPETVPFREETVCELPAGAA
jgi:hypothetical protein